MIYDSSRDVFLRLDSRVVHVEKNKMYDSTQLNSTRLSGSVAGYLGKVSVGCMYMYNVISFSQNKLRLAQTFGKFLNGSKATIKYS